MRNCWNENLYLEKLISGRGLLSLAHFHWALAHFPSRKRIYFAENFFKKYIRLYTPGLSYFFLWGLVTVHFLSGGRTINSKCCIKLNLTFSQSIKKFSMVISVCHMPSLNLDMVTTTFFLKWDYTYTHLIHWPSDRLTRSTPLHYYAFRTSLTWLGET